MHILVIGGNRFMGTLLIWRVLAGGHRVTTVNRGTLPDPFGARIERLRADRTTAAFDQALAGRTFDGVVDFAAFVGEDVRRVVRVLNGRIGHYVLISSGSVYLVRTSTARPASETDYAGSLVPAPAGPGHDLDEWQYGMGKRGCEDALMEAHRTLAFPGTVVRIPMVNGERDYRQRIQSYLVRILDGGPVLLENGGSHPVRHVYGGEVARFVTTLLERRQTVGQAWNLAQQETPTLAELVAELAGLLGAPTRIATVSADALRAVGLEPWQVSPFSERWMSFLDPLRSQRDLGFEHEPLRSYLGRIVAAFLAYPPETPPPNYAARDRERALVGG